MAHGDAAMRAVGTHPIGQKTCAERSSAFSARPQSCALRKPFVKCVIDGLGAYFLLDKKSDPYYIWWVS